MNIVTMPSLNRGAVLIEYAYSDNGRNLELSPADYVGIIAAYLGKGRYALDIEKELGSRMNPEIGQRAREVFELFDHWQGRGLWSQGPAGEDIRLTDWKLNRMYPGVNEARRRFLETL